MNPTKWIAIYFAVFVACTIGFAMLSSGYFDGVYQARVQRGGELVVTDIILSWYAWSLGFGLFCGMIFCFAHAYLLTHPQSKNLP